MKKKERLDTLLLEKGFFNSLDSSRSAILSGLVFLKGERQEKPGRLFTKDDLRTIEIREKNRFVSRGGYKLEKALCDFNLSVRGKICMDVGCSTGGFTDCLLKHGAQKVYAVDVGYGQFDFGLRNDPRVVLLEKQNIRFLDKSLIREKTDILAIDVSFISVTAFLPDILPLCSSDFDIIILVKPQFEAEKGTVRQGVVRSAEQHLSIIMKLRLFFNNSGLIIKDLARSPLKGPKGNTEFLLHLKEKGASLNETEIKKRIITGKEDQDKIF